MPWTCYLVTMREDDAPFRFELNGVPKMYSQLTPGAMWLDDGELCVKLPGGADWNVDRGRLLNERGFCRERQQQWTRTGEPPSVMAHPSINCVGSYHGWLKDGVLSDDIDGRRYV